MREQEAPMIALEERVKKEWLDYNGHMNVAYYTMIFDKALDKAFEALGIGEDYMETHGGSTFAVEHHTQFLGEMREGDLFEVHFHLLGFDPKRIHCWGEIIQKERGYTAAVSEMMNLHVDMNTRRTAAMPDFVQKELAAMLEAHSRLPRPEGAGRSIMQLKKADG